MQVRCALLAAACVLLAARAQADTNLKLVEVLTSPERTETLRELVEAFERRNPGTHVEITSLGWSTAFEKFATMVAAGDTPDVIEMPDRWVSLYADNGMLESLEPYLAGWRDLKVFTTDRLDLTAGDIVGLSVRPDDILLFDPESGVRLRASAS